MAPRDLTVADVINDLLAHLPAKWKSPLTLTNKKNQAARITGALGKVKLSRLTVTQVERFLEDTAAEGLSADTLRRLRAMLRLAIRRAERDRKVSRNVAALAEVPAGTRRQSRSMTLEETRALLGLKLNTWWRAYIVTALMTGLRPGELLGLRWEDVDFATGVIRVRKCLERLPDPATARRHLVLEDLKTERSRRTIQMPRQVEATLLALRKEQAARKLKLGAAYDLRGLAIVFGDRAGAPRWQQGCLPLLQAPVRAGWHRGELDAARAAAHVRLGAVGFGSGHRADRRRRGACQLDGDEEHLSSPDRRQGDSRGYRDGRGFRGGEQLVSGHRLPR